MTSFERRLPFGATLIGKNRTQFRLWAPAQEKVSVEIEGDAPVEMRRLADAWFEAEAPCGAVPAEEIPACGASLASPCAACAPPASGANWPAPAGTCPASPLGICPPGPPKNVFSR